MAGFVAPNLPIFGPVLQNTTTHDAGSFYPHMTGREIVGCDTEQTGGAAPQSAGVTSFAMMARAAQLAVNTGTSTAAAVTMNVRAGTITTEALTTAVGAVYTFTLTNSIITAALPAIQVDIFSGTNTTEGMVATSVVNGAGSAVIKFTNNGTAAINGTMVIAFAV